MKPNYHQTEYSMLKQSSWLMPCLLALTMALTACSRQDPETAAITAAPKRTASVEIVSREAQGFTAGAMMAANPVYVFFDAQCPHCGHLWVASVPLQKKVKFVWIPVGLLNASSGPQGAAIMSAAEPAKAMAEHETSMLAKQGGISAASGVKPEMEQAVKKNTALFTNLGLEGVPFIIARNARTGATVTRNGTLDTAGLAALAGVDP